MFAASCLDPLWRSDAAMLRVVRPVADTVIMTSKHHWTATYDGRSIPGRICCLRVYGRNSDPRLAPRPVRNRCAATGADIQS